MGVVRSLPVPATAEVREPAMAGADVSERPPVEAAAASDKAADAELRVEKYGRIGLALTIVGCALHFLGLVSRGLGADPIRVPWGNMYEFALAGTFGVSLMYLVLMKRYHLRWMGVLVTGFLVVVLMLDRARCSTRTPARWCPRCTPTGWRSTCSPRSSPAARSRSAR